MLPGITQPSRSRKPHARHFQASPSRSKFVEPQLRIVHFSVLVFLGSGRVLSPNTGSFRTPPSFFHWANILDPSSSQPLPPPCFIQSNAWDMESTWSSNLPFG